MAGVDSHNTLGVPMPFLRSLARSLGRDHDLALSLWASGIHEARILAALVDWALRSIGKRTSRLNEAAVATAREILASPDRASRWVASDALKELTSEAAQQRLRGRGDV